MNHRVCSPRPPRRTRTEPSAKNDIGHIIGVDVALGQVFHAGRSEYQGPAQFPHTTMVYRNEVVINWRLFRSHTLVLAGEGHHSESEKDGSWAAPVQRRPTVARDAGGFGNRKRKGPEGRSSTPKANHHELARASEPTRIHSRVIAFLICGVEFHFGKLFPRVGFIVTNFQTSNRAVVRFYNQRATAEQKFRLRATLMRQRRLVYCGKLWHRGRRSAEANHKITDTTFYPAK